MIINRIWISVMIPVHSRRSYRRWTVNVDVLFPLFLRYLQYPRLDCRISIPSSISLPILSFTRSVIFHPRDLVTCCNIGWNLTGWAQSIFPSLGRTNPALDAYASTYSIGKPKRHIFSHRILVWRLIQSKLPSEVVIKHDLMVLGLGYNISYYRNMNIVTQSCYIIILG
jgi:hypothetical protein